ncbi:MAG TPA: hemolysin III family protein [Acidimicrobiia bacterium]
MTQGGQGSDQSTDGTLALGPPLTPAMFVKPRFRGRLHQFTFWLTFPATLLLIVAGSHASSYVAAALYGASMALLFGASAAYHRGKWTPRVRAFMQRLDHAMIFVLIAGTYTPITLLALRPGWGITLLAIVWTIAAIGVTLTIVLWNWTDRHAGVLYIAFGWLAVVALPVIVHSLTTPELILMGAGGVLYTLGAIGFGREWPTLRPRTFGYHEAWHVMTVAAAACHYTMILLLIRA